MILLSSSPYMRVSVKEQNNMVAFVPGENARFEGWSGDECLSRR